MSYQLYNDSSSIRIVENGVTHTLDKGYNLFIQGDIVHVYFNDKERPTWSLDYTKVTVPTVASAEALRDYLADWKAIPIGELTIGSEVEVKNDSGNPVPVSGTVTANTGLSQPLTDTQLRASNVGVTVSNFPATQAVSGTVTANAGTGTFAVSAASLPLPSGASTAANQTTANSSLSSIDTKLSSQATAANQTNGSQKSKIVDSSGNVLENKISTDNSTTTPLTANSTYTGTWENVTNYSSIQVIANADVSGTLYADFSIDGITADRNVQLSDGTSGSFGIHGLIPISKFFRVRIVNGGSNQSSLRVQTTLNTEARISMPTSRMAQTLSDYSDVLNQRAVLVGKTEGGNYYQNISSSSLGHIETSIQGPLTAFGEVSVAEPSPVAQIDFVYGVNSYVTNSTTTGSGTVTGSGGLLLCSTTAATSSSAQLSSLRYIKYRPGQGARGLFTALFTTGVANSKQYAGLFTTSLNNGFGFGYNGATFGIWYMKNGTPTHIPQSSWSEDLMNGASGSTNKSGMNLVPTNGNVFKITYQYLGFGAIKFYIENNVNGQFVLVHQIQYANSNTSPSVSQPSLNLLWKAENTTNNTNIVVKGASGALFLEGQRRFLGASFGLDNNKSSITTQTNIITLKNATSYNGVNNRSHIRLRTISFASNANSQLGIATFKIVRNATLGGSPSYTTINGTTADGGVTITNGNSITSYDTAGTTVTGGTVIFNSIIGIGNNSFEDISEYDLFAYPGDILTFSITCTSSATAGVGVTWSEDV